MVKTNRKHRDWSPTKMTKAIEAIRSKKMGWKKASKEFSVPKTTLMRLSNIKYGTPQEAVNVKRGRPTVLAKIMEDELVNYCLAMEASFFGLTRADLRRMAVQLAERNNINHPFKNEMAGKKWVKLFLKRHKSKLSERKPCATSYSRALGFSKENTRKFYNLLDEVYEKQKFTPDKIYNVDESGITVVQSKVAKVIAFKGKKQIAALTSGERGALITIVACMNASGSYVPPLVIFPRKNMSEQLKKGAPPGTIFAAHPSGWIQTNSFTQWFQHFIQHSNPTEEKPVLLILDGHYSHTQNIDLIDLAKEHHVTILSLPPHCSHKLQPLDKTFMGPLKVFYSEEIRVWLRQNQRPLTAFDVMELFGRAYIRCQTAERAINGFRVTGIYPFNDNLFADVEYIEEANKKQPISFYESVKKKSLGPTDTPKTLPENTQELGANDLQGIVDFDPQQPSTSSTPQGVPPPLSMLEDPQTSTASKRTSPFDITPIPQVKKKTSNRGRKACSSTVITATPYKEQLVEAKQAKETKETEQQAKSRGQGRKNDRGRGRDSVVQPSKNGKELVKKRLQFDKNDDDSSDDESSVSSGKSVMENPPGVSPSKDNDAQCMFCDRHFSEDSRGELWVLASCVTYGHMQTVQEQKKMFTFVIFAADKRFEFILTYIIYNTWLINT